MSDKLSQIIADIKNKAEFTRVDDSFVKDLINKELNKNKKLRLAVQDKDFKHLKRSSIYKQLLKSVRAKLRQVYGVFVTGKESTRQKTLDELGTILKKHKITSEESIHLHTKLLNTHLSSKERLDHYKEVFKELFLLIKKPNSILDLGCGFNPFSLPFTQINLQTNKLNYFASDLNSEDCKFIQEYFDIIKKKTKNKFCGSTRAIDLTKAKKDPRIISSLPKSDICFLLKLLESIERRSHKLSEIIITHAPVKIVIASFPTKTISGKFMTRPERAWLERMCERMHYKFEKFAIQNEIFYVIYK